MCNFGIRVEEHSAVLLCCSVDIDYILVNARCSNNAWLISIWALIMQLYIWNGRYCMVYLLCNTHLN